MSLHLRILWNTAQEQQLPKPQIQELCAAYFGKTSNGSAPADKLAGPMKLNMIMLDVGWTLWAAIMSKDFHD